MFRSLPENTLDFRSWSWPQIKPYFDDLAERPLDTSNVAEWLADWSRLGSLLYETYQRLYVAITVNTTDQAAQQSYQAFLDQIYPHAQEADHHLKAKLLSSGLQPPGFEVPLRNMRTEAEIFSQANLPLLAQELKLSAEYDQIIGAQTIPWDGQELTLTQLQRVYQETNRQRREEAWRLAARRHLADRGGINELWGKFMHVRRQLAENAGFPDYRQYRWKQLLRFDYTPEDCRRFHQAIEAVAVPAAQRIYQRRQAKLGLDSLRPWDLYVDPDGLPPLRPYKDIEELISKTAVIFRQVDPQLGEYYDVMRQEALLDLDNRKGKAPGGYCTDFPVVRRPFIFANSIGLHEDVLTLLHEGGHAFHVFESAHLPYLQQLQVGMEFAEVASMSMELLASPYLEVEKGGFYSSREAARARIEHLETAICFWPYMAVVDAFQHWVYENHTAATQPENCDAKWAELWEQFMIGVDWSGFDDEKVTGWQRKLHIIQSPFYYIEYGLAQLGAFQVWQNAQKDQPAAVAAYRRALSLGGTAPIPELYRAAQAKFAFDASTLQEVIDLAEATIDDLE
ncbi:MAG: M3 family oligoendopeptidase [Anaerolineales bacterium]|nr:M3 family oligoendopeptidase [Anaerolineales bacterium]